MKKLTIIMSIFIGTGAFASSLDIQNIKRNFYKTEKEIKQGFISQYKKSKDIDGSGVNAVLYKKRGKIVKLLCESGSEDSYYKAEYFYRKNGKLYFSYVASGGVNGCSLEKRTYFNKRGKIIKRKIKNNGRCYYSYPTIIKNPISYYNSYCNF